MDNVQIIDAMLINPPIMEEISAGRKVSAIRATRQAFGTGLKEAKDLVEAIQKHMCQAHKTVHESRLQALHIDVAETPASNPLKAEPWDNVNVMQLTDDDILGVEDMKHLLASVQSTVRRFSTEGVDTALRDGDVPFLVQVLGAVAQAELLEKKLQKLQGSRMIRVPF